MVTIGVDAHKRLLVAVAVDAAGREIGTSQHPNTPLGWADLLDWATILGLERVWGVEGSGGLGRGCAQALVTAEETVYEINPRLTAAMRGRNRRQDKSDHWDGLAIARVVQRDAEQLPRIYPEAQTSVAALLTVERQRIQADLTSTRNQLHHDLHHLDPVFARRWSKLDARAALEGLAEALPAATTALETVLVASIRRTIARLLLLVEHLATLTQELELQGKLYYQELTELCGVSWMSSAMLAGMLGPVERFSHDAQVAAYAGVAPLETSSAGRVRHRLNRTGNRQFNAIVHRIALTQWRCRGEGRAYLERKQAEGKSWLEAMRALKRFIVRRIWQIWTRMHAPPLATSPLPLT